MDTSLLAGVSGLQAHQKMLDVAGNNLANMNTTAYKSSRVNFSDVLGTTLQEASQPTATVGGSNPMQIGGGVQVASIDRDMTQGTLASTGQPLDMAIDGTGFFVLNDGTKDVYTRMGSFALDSQNNLVDPSTGYYVQRITTDNKVDQFQDPANSNIHVPYDQIMPAQATSQITYAGNLSADEGTASQNVLTSGLQYTLKADGSLATSATLLSDLSQAGGLAAGDKIVISGTKADGTAVADTDFIAFAAQGGSKTVGDLVTAIQALYTGSTVSLNNGEIRVTDDATGYSQTDINLKFTSAGSSTFETPGYFNLLSAGGEATKNTTLDVYDAQGIAHSVSATFVKTDTANKWDLVVNSVSGDGVQITQRRIDGITFLSDGSFGSVDQADPTLQFKFDKDSNVASTISLNLGSTGEFNGLTQLGGSSTVSPGGQDGYGAGTLSSLSVSKDGVLVGVFSNGVQADVATIKLATFQNPQGLSSVGGNYYIASANSGSATECQAQSRGAGSIQSSTLEKSNVDMASEFVNLITAQSGYQANARTIKVATEMVSQLTNLIT